MDSARRSDHWEPNAGDMRWDRSDPTAEASHSGRCDPTEGDGRSDRSGPIGEGNSVGDLEASWDCDWAANWGCAEAAIGLAGDWDSSPVGVDSASWDSSSTSEIEGFFKIFFNESLRLLTVQSLAVNRTDHCAKIHPNLYQLITAVDKTGRGLI